MAQSNEFVSQFLQECRDGLGTIDSELVALEADPSDVARLNAVMRILHSIKGNAGFLDFPLIVRLAHAGETLFVRLADSHLSLDPEVIDLSLRAVDALRSVLAVIEATASEGEDHFAPILSELENLAAGEKSLPPIGAQKTMAERRARESQPPVEGVIDATTRKYPRQPESLPPKSIAAPADPLSQEKPKIPSDPTVASKVGARRPLGDEAPPEVEPLAAPASTADSELAPKLSESRSSMLRANDLRVKVSLLTRLMNIAGEMVLNRNRIMQLASDAMDPDLSTAIQQLDLLTSSLQEAVLKVRMQKIGVAWQHYPRMVRDLARQCGKGVKLDLEGADTELDKILVDAIANPLTHLLRNAVDHGIEKPYLRRIKGKPEQGHIRVSARHEAGQVHIEISDDGAGLDREKIRSRMTQRGLATVDSAAQLSDRQLQDAIFLQGFSTADQLSDISGRGVGMDVVKSSIESIGGSIEIDSRQDVGTTIRLTVPLTLAIVPAMLIRSGGQRFAVPQLNVMEALRYSGEASGSMIEPFLKEPVLRHRDDILPVVDLAKQMGMAPEKSSNPSLCVIVVRAGTRRFALVVDEIGATEEIVVKPLGETLEGLSQYAGVAVMGDGDIALILDVLGLARLAGLFATDQWSIQEPIPAAAPVSPIEESLLVCQVGDGNRIALPASSIVRIDELSALSFEKTSQSEALNYFGQALPIVRLARALGLESAAGSTSRLVVCQSGGQSFGIVVDRVVDIAETPGELETRTAPGLIQASGIVLGHVTELLDVDAVMKQLPSRV